MNHELALTNVKLNLATSEETFDYSAILTYRGKPAFYVESDGRGAAPRFYRHEASTPAEQALATTAAEEWSGSADAPSWIGDCALPNEEALEAFATVEVMRSIE